MGRQQKQVQPAGNGGAPSHDSAADLRARILAADDRKLEKVPCPEWDTAVFVRALTAGQRAAMEADLEALAEGDSAGTAITAVIHMACDREGAAIFTAEDMEALRGRRMHVIWRIYMAGSRLNALSVDDVEEAEGNSEGIPERGSTFA